MQETAPAESPTLLLERQVATLVGRGYPIEPYVDGLRERIGKVEPQAIDIERGALPFVVVVSSRLVPAETMMSRVVKDGRAGVTKLYPREPSDFSSIDSVTIPDSPIYLLVGIDRGKATINQPPAEALQEIMAAGRSPLTIDEGIAIVTHFPDFLAKNNCFSLAASRHPDDRRVPAIWINKQKHPNLGWCWAGNPHTWLGTASCSRRL